MENKTKEKGEANESSVNETILRKSHRFSEEEKIGVFCD